MANPQIEQFTQALFWKAVPWIVVVAVLGGLVELVKGKRSRRRSRVKSSTADALVLLPWWVSVIVAFLVYAVLPGFLPPAIAKGGLTGIVALGLLALAALSAFRSWKMRNMLEQQTGIDSIRELPWKRFEDLLAEAYRRQGYKVQETLGGGADGGVDLVLGRDGEVILVQCKRWKGKPVPVQTVRELYGVLHDRRASAAKLVATTTFTSEATAFAKNKPIELVDAEGLLSLLRGVQTSGRIAREDASTERRGYSDHLTPGCPNCGSEMKLREARRGANAGGKFWGCSRYPDCRGTTEV
jgi:restriction system protein